MATNLISLITQFLTPDMVARIASTLGLDRTAAQKAVGASVPALLAALVNVASTSDGAQRLSSMVSRQPTGAMDNILNSIAGAGPKGQADGGWNVLSTLLGSGTTGALTGAIGKFAGIGEGPSKSLLGMLGPLVMGAVGQEQRKAGLDADGLASLLASQKDKIVAALPAGLADRLSGTGLMEALQGGLRSGMAAGSTVAARTNRASEEAMGSASRATFAVRDKTSAAGSRWLAAIAALAVLGGIAWYLFGSGGVDRMAKQAPPAKTQPIGDSVGLAPPDLTVGGVDLVRQIDTSIGGLRAALTNITDSASAEAALPNIREATAQLDKVGILAAQLPAERRSAIAKLIAAAMPTINQLCDKALATPGVGSVAKPAIDELRGKLDQLTRA